MKILSALAITAAIPVALLVSCGTGQSSSLDESMIRGKKVYEQYCLTCHQADGSGVPNLNPPLRQTDWVLGEVSTLVRIVHEGFSENVEIDGVIYNNPMPGFGKVLDAQQTADVLSYIRNSFGNRAGEVTVEEVQRVIAK